MPLRTKGRSKPQINVLANFKMASKVEQLVTMTVTFKISRVELRPIYTSFPASGHGRSHTSLPGGQNPGALDASLPAFLPQRSPHCILNGQSRVINMSAGGCLCCHLKNPALGNIWLALIYILPASKKGSNLIICSAAIHRRLPLSESLISNSWNFPR